LTDEANFQYKKNGNWTNAKIGVKTGDEVILGNVKLIVDSMDYYFVRTTTLKAGSGVVFNILYDVNGNWINLPTEQEFPTSVRIFEVFDKGSISMKKLYAFWKEDVIILSLNSSIIGGGDGGVGNQTGNTTLGNNTSGGFGGGGSGENGTIGNGTGGSGGGGGGSACSNGCSFEDRCVPYEYRTGSLYCNINGEMLDQVQTGGNCNNDYECRTDEYSNNVCVDLSAEFKSEVSGFRKFICRIFGWAVGGYDSCIAS